MTMGGAAQAVSAKPLAHSGGRRDPLTLILGPRERWDLFTIGMAIAMALHGTMLVFGIISGLLRDLHLAVDENRARIHDFFWREYDVVVDKPKVEEKPPEPPPPEPPPPEPAPAPVPKAATKPVEDDPYKNVAPTPAQAAKVLTAAPKDDDPVELPTIVSGEGTALGGMQSTAGKGDQITMARKASLTGEPGGKGTASAAPPPPPPGPDLSREVALAGGASWNCPFPPEADADQIDIATVTVQVTVKADGSAGSVSVVSDPGHGFGRAARSCALSRRYQPALDRTGTAIAKTTMVNVRFNR